MATCIGCGLKSSPAGLLEVELRPGGGIECDPDGADAGLFLTPAGPATISTAGGDCTIISGNGAPGTPLRVDMERSPDPCNALVCRGNGLYVPCLDSEVGSYGSSSGVFTQPVVGPNNPYAFEDSTAGVAICNPTCCEMTGFVEIKLGGAYVDMDASSRGFGVIQTRINGGGWVSAVPPTDKVVHNHVAGSPVLLGDINNLEEQNFISVASDICYTYEARLLWTQAVGTAVVRGNVEFEYYWHLSPHNCCDEL